MRLVLITAAITLGFDQLTKWLVVWQMDLARVGEIEVWPPFLTFRMAWNYGVNFGLGASSSAAMKWLLIGVALAITLFVLVWVRRAPPGRAGRIAAGLLVGGAIGNVIDRLAYGAVADFLNMSCCGFEKPYAFNIADIAIFLGAIGLAFLPPARRTA